MKAPHAVGSASGTREDTSRYSGAQRVAQERRRTGVNIPVRRPAFG